MPIVQMPDGVLVDMPDNPDPQLLADLESIVGTPDSPLKRQAKLIGSDVVKGAGGLPAMSLDVGREVLNLPFTLGEQLGDRVMGREPKPYAPIGPKASVALQNFGVKPETEAERWQSAITQGAVGGVASPGGLTRPLVQAVTGAVSSVGAETAARLGGDNAAMRLLGGLAGGMTFAGGASLLNRSSPRVTELARESLDGIDPAQLQQARTFMEGAGKNGMPLDYAQALEATGAQPAGMRVLRDTLANVKEGDRTQALLKAQPGQLQDLAGRWVDNQPGSIYAPEQAANNLSEAATGVIQGAKDARQDVWKAAYKKTLERDMAEAVKALEKATADSATPANKLATLRSSIEMLKKQQEALESAAANLREADQTFKLPTAGPQTASELPSIGTDSRGNLRQLPKIGEAIIFNQIAKETRDSGKFSLKLPPVTPAPSLPTLSAEAAAARQAARVHQLENLLPGYTDEVAKAAEKVKMTEAGIKAVRAVPTELVESERRRLQDLAVQAVPSTAKGKALLQLSKDLEGLTDGAQINEVLKNAIAKTKTVNLDTPGMDAATAKWVQRQVQELRENFGKSFSPLRNANTAFARYTSEVVDPLKQGQIGGLATKRGYSADTQAPLAKMNALFSAGRDPAARHSPLLDTARKLNKQDPTAFADAAKTYYSGKISEAFDAGIGAGGRATNKDAGQKLYNSLFADSKQYAGMRDVVTATAESAGRKPAEALRGLENFAKIVRATRSQPDAIGGMTRQQIMEMAEKHYGANAIRIFGFLPFERMARNMESATMSKTFRELDKLITTPEGVDILIKLSQTPVMDKRALALAATAGGMLQFTGKNGEIMPE